MLAWSTGSAAAASNGLWSIFPATPPGRQPNPYVEVSLSPGHPYLGSVVIENLTTAPLVLNLYAADGLNTSSGALALRRRGDAQVGIGSWTHLGQDQVTVPVRKKVVVPFAIDAPPNAAPGDHVGGIVAEQTQGTPSSSGSLPVTVVQAVAVRIYARVRGPLHPALAVSGTTMELRGGGAAAFGGTVAAKVHFTVTNRGNVAFDPRTSVSLSTPLGTAAHRQMGPVGPLLPGSSVSYEVTFGGVAPFAHLRAAVTAWAQGTRASGSASAVVLPWALVAMGVALMGLVILMVVLRRHRRTAARWAKADPSSRSP